MQHLDKKQPIVNIFKFFVLGQLFVLFLLHTVSAVVIVCTIIRDDTISLVHSIVWTRSFFPLFSAVRLKNYF